MKKRILFVFTLLVIIMMCSCGSSSAAKNMDAEDSTKKDEHPLTEQQMVYDRDGYTLYASYIDFEEYGQNGIGIAMYAINNSGAQRDIQTSYATINGNSIEMKGVNQGGRLLDGQKGWFYQIIYYDDLDAYGIDVNEDLKSLSFQLQIWNKEEFEILDEKDIELIVNQDMTFKLIDNADDRYTVHRVYGIASNMKKSDLDGTAGNWSYQGLPLLSDDCEWIDNSLNKNGTVNQSAIYMKIAYCLEGFSIGNDWKSYAEWVIGYIPESKEEFAEHVDNAKEFIVTENQLKAIMKKFNTLDCVEGEFDFDYGKFGAYIVDIQDLTICAKEMGVSEEMLGYILAMVSSYGANITFDGNGCHIEY